ncbi:5-methylcytosine-specific restriction endonuclease McrA [Bradyrhizobium sp. LB1.3]
MLTKKCTICGEEKPATLDYWGSTPAGNLRGYCNVCMNQRSRQYEAQNKEKRKVRDARRAARAPGARTGFGSTLKRELWDKQNGICPCCFQMIDFAENGEVDHMIPLAKGGVHDRSNFILAHSRCNRDKKDKTLEEHWDWRVKVGHDVENLGSKHGLVPPKSSRELSRR